MSTPKKTTKKLTQNITKMNDKKKLDKKAPVETPTTEVSAKPADNNNNVKQELPKQFFVGIVNGVRWDLDPYRPSREFTREKVYSDRDLANEIDTANKLIEDKEKELVAKGWFLSDYEAAGAARKAIREMLDRISLELEYDDDKKDRERVAGAIRRLANMMRQVDNFTRSRETFISEQAKKHHRADPLKFCPILPEIARWPNADVSDSGIVSFTNNYRPAMHEVVLNNEQKEAISKIVMQAASMQAK